LELPPSLCSVPRILGATAHIGRATSFCEPPTSSPRTGAAIKLTLPCWKSKCLKFSMRFAAE